MKYSEAKTKFDIRLYQWAKTAQQMEIQESFPSFRLCNSWVAKTCLFFQGLNPHSRTVLGQGLLQRMHPEAVKALGETISPETEVLIRREENYRVTQLAQERMRTAFSGDQKPSLAKARQLRKAITTHFKAAFGDICLPPEPLDGKPDLIFRMRCHGWVIKTLFEFGRWFPEIRYDHSAWTGKWITKEEPAVLFANCIGFRLSYGNVLGIGSGWDNIAVDGVEPVCVAVVDHSRRMFDLFPKLLEGLELESLTP